ncbi:hypothetical protein F5Y17DRAFT_45387 [Xylariaceae sp. FL0594]|nr:hypothetical protein F5Y17DRAFT_45387 [Xylariaceae sp. FL0594]
MFPVGALMEQQRSSPEFGYIHGLEVEAKADGQPISSRTKTTMAGVETSETSGSWASPPIQGSRPRPASIFEGFSFCAADGFCWNDFSNPCLQTPTEPISRPVSMHQNFSSNMGMDYGTSSHNSGVWPLTNDMNLWRSELCEENLEMPRLDDEMAIGQALTADEAIPLSNLGYSSTHMDKEVFAFVSGSKRRRMSGASFAMSTMGIPDMPPFEEFPPGLSEAPSLASDYLPTSNRNSLISSTQLSPVASPRLTPQGRSELVRAQSRGRAASPSPRSVVRSAPYYVENNCRSKRWSTGSYGTGSNRRPPPFVHHHTHDTSGARMPTGHASPLVPTDALPFSLENVQCMPQYPALISASPALPSGVVLPSTAPPLLSNGVHAEPQHFATAPPLMTLGSFKTLQSNADAHLLSNRHDDLSVPPDLYSALLEDETPPPPEDMNPSDPEMVPREQDARDKGSLFTPRWVRGHGKKREGWCGICKPGKWLVLKNSAFWYDKSFTHGISAKTGNRFPGPLKMRRANGSADGWEGLCGSCNNWIALRSSKNKGTAWFRHVYEVGLLTRLTYRLVFVVLCRSPELIVRTVL